MQTSIPKRPVHLENTPENKWGKHWTKSTNFCRVVMLHHFLCPGFWHAKWLKYTNTNTVNLQTKKFRTPPKNNDSWTSGIWPSEFLQVFKSSNSEFKSPVTQGDRWRRWLFRLFIFLTAFDRWKPLGWWWRAPSCENPLLEPLKTGDWDLGPKKYPLYLRCMWGWWLRVPFQG